MEEGEGTRGFCRLGVWEERNLGELSLVQAELRRI